MTGRFAPSITGEAHPGTLLAGLLAWLDARSRGDRFLVRLDRNRQPGRRDEDVARPPLERLVPDARPSLPFHHRIPTGLEDPLAQQIVKHEEQRPVQVEGETLALLRRQLQPDIAVLQPVHADAGGEDTQLS